MRDVAPLCPPCIEKRMRWLDSNPLKVLPSFGIAYGSGALYDVSAAGVLDRRRARYEQWRALVREQMAGIASDCRKRGHVAATPPTAVRVVQLDLLELALAGGGARA
jgi:hypothetical protein